MWNKLYKKALFDSIRYPEGRVFEDLSTTHKLVHNAKKIMMISDYLYFKVRRKNSITYSRLESKMKDYFTSALERKTI